MKKFLVCLILLSVTSPSYAFWGNKIDKALEKELQGKGYAGKLPDIGEKIEKTKVKVASPQYDVEKNFDDPADLKPIPKDNPAFINIIQKKDKASQYVTDTSEIIPMLEKLVDCIEDNENVQLFVSKANLLTSNIDYLSKKYEGKSESFYESFKKLLEVNQYVKSIATLRHEAMTYQRYLAYSASGSIYNPENIAQQLDYLKEEINNVILMLREEG